MQMGLYMYIIAMCMCMIRVHVTHMVVQAQSNMDGALHIHSFSHVYVDIYYSSQTVLEHHRSVISSMYIDISKPTGREKQKPMQGSHWESNPWLHV